MKDNIVTFLGFVGIIVLIIAIPVLILSGINIMFNVNLCDNLAELNPDRHFEWRLFGGCLMQTQEGIWLQMDDITFLDKPINGVK